MCMDYHALSIDFLPAAGSGMWDWSQDSWPWHPKRPAVMNFERDYGSELEFSCKAIDNRLFTSIEIVFAIDYDSFRYDLCMCGALLEIPPHLSLPPTITVFPPPNDEMRYVRNAWTDPASVERTTTESWKERPTAAGKNQFFSDFLIWDVHLLSIKEMAMCDLSSLAHERMVRSIVNPPRGDKNIDLWFQIEDRSSIQEGVHSGIIMLARQGIEHVL